MLLKGWMSEPGCRDGCSARRAVRCHSLGYRSKSYTEANRTDALPLGVKNTSLHGLVEYKVGTLLEMKPIAMFDCEL